MVNLFRKKGSRSPSRDPYDTQKEIGQKSYKSQGRKYDLMNKASVSTSKKRTLKKKPSSTVKNVSKTKVRNVNNNTFAKDKPRKGVVMSSASQGNKSTFTIKGNTIYSDEKSGNTIASKATRQTAVSDPRRVKTVGSRTGLLDMSRTATPDDSMGTSYNKLEKLSSDNARILKAQSGEPDLAPPIKISENVLPSFIRDFLKRMRKGSKGGTGSTNWRTLIR